ncbi:MAG: toll/interleukin-1 receptor domain-containing protein [Pseudomonadota bacterium]
MKGFISYAHDDYAALKAVRKHFAALERAFDLSLWADLRIRPGDYWSGKIEKAIEDASVHLLLVSPSFFQSDYIFNHELPAIQAKYKQGDLVIPIIVSRCCWEAFLGPLQATPTDPTHRILPIRDWKPQDNGLDAARAQVQQAIQAHFDCEPNGMDWERT